MKKTIQILPNLIAYTLLFIAVVTNLWIYRLETTSKVDPNDNPFQFALVERTNQIWNYAEEKCGINPICFSSYLIDHWVPNWAQGYSLPYYYSHAPQIAIVATYRIVSFIFRNYSLFTHYHYIIYLLLCLFPISVFLALKKIRLPIIIVGIGSLVASHISTDGLYGLDPSSFLWRGYGLTSQLFAMIWLPLSLGYFFHFLNHEAPLPPINTFLKNQKSTITLWIKYSISSDLIKTIILLVLAISGHLGLGVILLLSFGVISIAHPLKMFLEQQPQEAILAKGKKHFYKLSLVAGSALFLLSYWILPAFVNNKYHNISFWDPVWKFNSWGWKEVMNLFLNGNLFDFGRFPTLTILLLIGLFTAWFFSQKKNSNDASKNPSTKQDFFDYSPFTLLFIFWLLMFFGRSTWGGLIDLIPGMKEFHQSRFIVGVHLTGFFLIPLGVWHTQQYLLKYFALTKSVLLNGIGELSRVKTYEASKMAVIISAIFFSGVLVAALYPQTIRYAQYNDVLIARGNENYNKQNPDVEKLFQELKKLPPGRVFTGRGGSWGKRLQLAETTYYMHLSTYGVPVILWLPETWSPNSDIEQFFIEEREDHYDLMNVKYVVTPTDLEPQKFWKLLAQNPQWKLYAVQTSGYFGIGANAATIKIEKTSYINLVRLWLQSDYPKNQIFPSSTFSRNEMVTSSLPAFEMVDEASYKTRDNQLFSLFGSQPTYEAPKPKLRLLGPELVKADMEFSTTVEVDQECKQCMIFLKQSYHPNWKVKIDGKPAKTIISFPYYIGIRIEDPGKHTISYYYQPSLIKVILFTLAIFVVICVALLIIIIGININRQTKITS